MSLESNSTNKIADNCLKLKLKLIVISLTLLVKQTQVPVDQVTVDLGAVSISVMDHPTVMDHSAMGK